MASVIQGYEYDIFISYRQKDNKHEGWVTEFVNQLKGELEATFKEDISIYFDENPHDGLLETHDVYESLKEKLKCLVFIPVISRTYCDPKSFAWENELKAFIELASEDRFGLKITLMNRNVVNRVLPVRIHELDSDDNKLCEETLGGVIRGVEFIYKSPGVNRPLRSEEDNPKDNINKTYYRDQINKVANVIAEIIHSMKSADLNTNESVLPVSGPAETVKEKFHIRKSLIPAGNIKKILLTLLAIIVLAGVLFGYRYLYRSGREKIFAFIPLRNTEIDTSLNIAAPNFIEAVYNKLDNIKEISPVSRFRMEQCRDEKELNSLLKESGTDFMMVGNFRKADSKISLWVELITCNENKRLWSNEYPWDEKMISVITGDVVRSVIVNLKKRITRSEMAIIDKEPTLNTSALYDYISGNRISNDALLRYLLGNKMLDSTSILSSIESYTDAVRSDTMFAEAYAGRAIARSWGIYMRQLDSSHLEKCIADIKKARNLNKDLPETENALGFYYYYCADKPDSALLHFSRASSMDPGDYRPLFYMALVYRKTGQWERSQQLMREVIRLRPRESIFLTNIGLSYTYLHKFDSAIIYHQAAIDALPSWYAPYLNKIEALLLKNGNTAGAWSVYRLAANSTTEDLTELQIRMLIYDKKYREAFDTAHNRDPSVFRFPGNKYLLLAQISRLLKQNQIAESYIDTALISFKKYTASEFNDHLLHSYTGIALAYKGDAINAEAEAQLAMKQAEKNILDKLDTKIIMAMIHVILGEYDKASPLIEDLLNGPSCFSLKLLQIDPVWAPFLSSPEYSTIINKSK